MFTANELAILIPTKDRPDKIRKLLESIQNQSLPIGQIIIPASGQNIADVMNDFSSLPIEYHHLAQGGQIRQRNFGLQKLKPEIGLVCLLDDDVVLLPGSLAAMLDFFNNNTGLGGACFNVVNTHPFRFSWLKYFFQMAGKRVGEVTRAGYNTRITNVDKDYPVQWIIGGAGCWRKGILQKHPYPEWDDFHYAINEDVYYSFPLSFEYRFAVCAQAKLEHYPDLAPARLTIAFGEAHIRQRLHLVKKNNWFSLPLAYWASLGQILENLLRGYWKAALGNIKGIFQSIFSKSPQ